MRTSRRRLLWALGAALPIALLSSASPRAVRKLCSALFAGRARGSSRLAAGNGPAAALARPRGPRLVQLDRERIGPAAHLAG